MARPPPAPHDAAHLTYDGVVSELPASVRLALWMTARGAASSARRTPSRRAFPDLDHVAGDLARLDVWRDLGERALFVALPRPGDISGMPRGVGRGHGRTPPTPASASSWPASAGCSSRRSRSSDPRATSACARTGRPTRRSRCRATAWRCSTCARSSASLMTRLREHTARFDDGRRAPWGQEARAEAAGRPRHRPLGHPAGHVRPRAAPHVAGGQPLPRRRTATPAAPRSGPEGSTPGPRRPATRLLRDLAADADAALADATNVAVMTIAGWRPA